MKTKLQALIEEQKALTARFEELLTSEQFVDVNKKVYIKGHPTRGDEVIKMLEDLGGVNTYGLNAVCEDLRYGIDSNSHIVAYSYSPYDTLHYTELHLPEAVSTENTQTSDIKVGDWYILDEPYIECGLNDRMMTEPFVIHEASTSFDNNIAIVKFADGDQCELYKLKDKFHKVDPPKEEVELIEGEVYARTGVDYIFILGKDYTALCRTGIHGFSCGEGNRLCFNNKEITPATPEQRKQLFDALKEAGKHFDKENLRLLDIEEWECKRGEAFIGKYVEGAKWTTKVFTGYVSGDTLGAENGGTYIPIPYNNETIPLIGTTNNPEKHYIYIKA